jgi:hypothetical protein
MGHVVRGFISNMPLLRGLSGRYEHAYVAELQQGFGLLPIIDTLFDEITLPIAGEAGTAKSYHELFFLSRAIEAVAKDASEAGPIAYIETDYFGGVGTQSAIVWNKGEVEFGPAETARRLKDPSVPEVPLLDGAINRALRVLGVVRGDYLDEFDALGLGKLRYTEDWAESAGWVPDYDW